MCFRISRHPIDMRTFPEYESFDGLGLAALVQRGVVSPAELLEAAIERVDTYNPKLNAVIHTFYEQAKQTISHGPVEGIFQGVPFLLKDLLADYAGEPLSSGSRFTHSWKPDKDSELVSRFKKSGLIIFGKTNVPEFGLSPVTESVLWGPAHNPWDISRSPGGSSGGSAAAVAAGMVPMAHGNDGGGSIRIPASYCGLFGFKPSRGRNPSGSSIMRTWEAMVVEHVLTRSVRDSAAMLDVLAGPEIGSSIALPAPTGSYRECLNKSPGKLQIALSEQPFFAGTVSEEYIHHLHKAGLLCQDLGHVVEPVTLTINSHDVAIAYTTVLAGEIAATLKRLTETMGHKPKHSELEIQTEILSCIGHKMKASDFAWAREVLENAARHMAEFFQDYDVLMIPTMGVEPPRIGQLKLDMFENAILEVLTHVPLSPLIKKAMEYGSIKNFANIPFTPIFNISGQPAMSAPLYQGKQGLPIGIQFAAKIGAEEILFQLAAQLEKAMPWFERRPLINETIQSEVK